MNEWVQIGSLVISLFLFGGAATLLVLAAKDGSRFHSGVVTRYLTVVILLLAILGIYSSSTFLWGDLVPDWFFDIARYITLSLRTTIVIIIIAIVLYMRPREKR